MASPLFNVAPPLPVCVYLQHRDWMLAEISPLSQFYCVEHESNDTRQWHLGGTLDAYGTLTFMKRIDMVVESSFLSFLNIEMAQVFSISSR